MKLRITFCMCLMSALTVSAVMAEPIEVLNHSFEYLNGEDLTLKVMDSGVDDWEFATGPDGNGIEDPSSDGDVCVAIGGVDSVFQLLDHTIAPGDEYTLTFDAFYLWSSAAWDATFEGRLYYDDNGSREVLDYAENNFSTGMPDWAWHYDYTVNTTVPLGSPAIGKQLGIELAVTAQASNSWFGFDNVRLDGVLQTGAAVNPDPYVGEEEVELSRVFTWQIGEDPNNPGNPMPGLTGYYIYLGTDETAVAAAGTDDLSGIYRGFTAVGEESYTPSESSGPLVNDETYYWRIDERLVDDANTIGGKIWMFFSERTLPEVAEQPKDVYAFPGETAVLTTAAAPSPTTLFYQWYRGESPDRTNPVDGGDAAELSISDVIADDEGLYYCRITNDAGDVDTQSALLTVKRLMGHWKMDGNLDDATGNGHGGLGDPNFVNGKDGSAVQFISGSEAVVIEDSIDYFNFYPNGFTLSVWVNTTPQSGWIMFATKSIGLVAGFHIGTADISGYGFFTLREHNGAGNGDVISDVVVNDGQWHLVTGVFEPDTQLLKIYVDGELSGTTPNANTAEMLGTDIELTIGPGAFTGLIDDVQIYNYAVDPIGIALLYTDFNPGETVCLDNVGLQFDFSGNCRIDIADLVYIAESWMNCGKVPGCLP